jgi:hypothetical protein
LNQLTRLLIITWWRLKRRPRSTDSRFFVASDPATDGVTDALIMWAGKLETQKAELMRLFKVIRHKGTTGSAPDPSESRGGERTRRVRPPPGHRLLLVAELVFSRRSFEEILVPTIADMRIEYCDALAAGRRGKAWWVHLRGYISFVAAVGALGGVRVVKLAVRIGKIIN